MTINLHIGTPKAFSTLIQMHLAKAERAGQIQYLGFRPENDIHDWYKHPVESELLNQGLRYMSYCHFQSNCKTYAELLREKAQLASDQNIPLYLSSENLSMRGFMDEIDAYEKLNRLNQLIPQKKRFIVVIRNIKDMVLSMYKEYVKHGYTENLSFFLEESYQYRECNYIDALLPNNVLSNIEATASEEDSVTLLFANKNNLRALLIEHFQPVIFSTAHSVNAGLSLQQSEQGAAQNKKSPIGNKMSGMSETHRFFWNHLSDENFSEELTWSNRRTIIKNMEQDQQLPHASKLGSQDNYDEAFRSSKLYQYLSEQYESDLAKRESSKLQITLSGSYESIWTGIKAA